MYGACRIRDSTVCEYCSDHSFHFHCMMCTKKYIPGSDSDTLCSQYRRAGKDEVIK